jgi:hypothetical protein
LTPRHSAAELATVSGTDEEKAAFVQMQFAAQARYYREHHPDTSYDVILLDGLEVGRLYVARWSGRHRPAARLLQLRYRDDAAARTAVRGGSRRQAAPHPRRTLQSCP